MSSEDFGETVHGSAGGRELVRGEDGRVIAAILEEQGRYILVKKEKATFPPSARESVVGTFDTLVEARERAERLK